MIVSPESKFPILPPPWILTLCSRCHSLLDLCLEPLCLPIRVIWNIPGWHPCPIFHPRAGHQCKMKDSVSGIIPASGGMGGSQRQVPKATLSTAQGPPTLVYISWTLYPLQLRGIMVLDLNNSLNKALNLEISIKTLLKINPWKKKRSLQFWENLKWCMCLLGALF